MRPSPGPSELPTTTLRDRMVLLLTNGMTIEAAEDYCVCQAGCDPDAARRIVAEAAQGG